MRHSKVSCLEIDEIEVILVSEMKRHFYKNFDYFHETSHENFKVSIVKINTGTVLKKKGEDFHDKLKYRAVKNIRKWSLRKNSSFLLMRN